MKPWIHSKSWTLASALLCLITTNTLQGAIIVNPSSSPPVVFSVQPEENGHLVYLPVAPEHAASPQRNMIGFVLNIVNNGEVPVRLVNIRVTFAGQPELTVEFSRDIEFAPNQTQATYLAPEEAIQLPEPPPDSAQISLFFEGYRTPVTLQRDLAPYQPPGPGGFYLFPGKASDLGPNQYWSNKARHTGGSQFFGYDLVVRDWNPDEQEFQTVKPGGDADKNEDRVGWNIPIHAMADGVVLRASTGWEDNPKPGTRAVQRMGDHLAGPITDVKVTRFNSSRAASVVRQPSGELKITIWDTEDNGRVITERGSAEAEQVSLITADALTSSRLVTAIRTDSGQLRVILWGISGNGQTITRLAERDASAVKEISLIKLTSTRFATAVKTEEDALRLIIWEVSDDESSIALLSHEFAGTASSISVTALSASRVVTALQTAGGALKVIVWDLLDDGTTIDRLGDATGDAIQKVIAVKSSSSHFYTAAQDVQDLLQIVWWNVSEDGLTVTAEFGAGAGVVQALAGASSFDETLLTAVVTAQGTYKNILWLPDTDDGALVRWGESEAGLTDRLAIDELDEGLFFSGVRTADGDLKVITWWVGHGGGNSLVILHGNCRTLYAHMRDGSVDPTLVSGTYVSAGQFLGGMGNSGSSSGPHLHIHCSRISSFLTPEEAIEMELQGNLDIIAYRPIPFHGAEAMRLDLIQPVGEPQPNAFALMQNHGVYFDTYGIRPTWTPPSGRGLLTYTVRDNGLVLDWESDLYGLEHTADLDEPNWLPWPRGEQAPVQVPMLEDHGFFRLHRLPSQLSHFGLR